MSRHGSPYRFFDSDEGGTDTVEGGIDTPEPDLDAAIDRTSNDDDRLAVVEEYADRVLDLGRDRWSGESTPLLVDGVHADTHEPVTWNNDGREFVLHNLASQQTLCRVLTGLSALTGESRYVDAAGDAVSYHFEHLVDDSGLFHWGGHKFVDLRTLEPVGDFSSHDVHELKTHFPFLDLLWAVDERATARYVRALWDAHVLDWSRLDMNRHGDYGESGDLEDPWTRPWDDPDPFFEGDGLTFVNIGTDLIWAAGVLADVGDEAGAWTWGRRLAEMYVKARHPDTGLGVYQYSKPRREREPPSEGSLVDHTRSVYGDRAENQFGGQFGDVAREGWVLWGKRLRRIYVRNPLVQLRLSERLGDSGSELRTWTADGLEAFAEHAYDPGDNVFRPMWADGTALEGRTFDRTGYYGSAGSSWEPVSADTEFLLAFARAHRLTGREPLWRRVRAIARGLGIGDVGERPGEDVSLDLSTPSADPSELFALIELVRTDPHPEYVDRARAVADRIVDERYHEGFFLPTERHVHAEFDALEPLALLALDATLRGRPRLVPEYVGGNGRIHGRFDGMGSDRVYDTEAIWDVTRDV